MTALVGNVNSTLRIPLILFMVLGLWAPNHFGGLRKRLFNMYTVFSYMFLVGMFIIVQVGDLYQVWGNVSPMTATMFLIFTNFALSGKLINIVLRKREIQSMIAEVKEDFDGEKRQEGIKIIKICDRETTIQLYVYIWLSYVTILGWAASAEKNQLPLRAWYPYDVSESPAYHLTYAHQCIALFLGSALNIGMDTVANTLICQCRCRLQLLALSLTTLCDGVVIDEKGLISQEQIVIERLRRCIQRHQAALDQARRLQAYFSAPVLGQFSVSMFIICVTAYQLAFESTSVMRVFAMVAYLADMMLQVFLYCYQGNELLDEIIKASYSFFTVLQQVEE